ncbi:MAG: hypothetical protein C5B60_10985 [Chloroflexi bacterium]|nr:MAG: hypothetical protein C5B60_10985 [Chloroflexota bacterium]
MTGAKVFRVGQSACARYPALYSPMVGTCWRAARKHAKLNKDKVEPKSGIHAYRRLRDAVHAQRVSDQCENHPERDAAYAIVVPEGRTVIGQIGWVAESAVIRRIFLPRHLYVIHARGLYQRYRVPIEVLPDSLLRSHSPPLDDLLDKPLPISLSETQLKLARAFGLTPDQYRKALVSKHLENEPRLTTALRLRYGPDVGAKVTWSAFTGRLRLALPPAVGKAAKLVRWDPDVARIAALRTRTLPPRPQYRQSVNIDYSDKHGGEFRGRDQLGAARVGDTLHLFVPDSWKNHVAHLTVSWHRSERRARRVVFWSCDYDLLCEVGI